MFKALILVNQTVRLVPSCYCLSMVWYGVFTANCWHLTAKLNESCFVCCWNLNLNWSTSLHAFTSCWTQPRPSQPPIRLQLDRTQSLRCNLRLGCRRTFPSLMIDGSSHTWRSGSSTRQVRRRCSGRILPPAWQHNGRAPCCTRPWRKRNGSSHRCTLFLARSFSGGSTGSRTPLRTWILPPPMKWRRNRKERRAVREEWNRTLVSCWKLRFSICLN